MEIGTNMRQWRPLQRGESSQGRWPVPMAQHLLALPGLLSNIVQESRPLQWTSVHSLPAGMHGLPKSALLQLSPLYNPSSLLIDPLNG